MLKLAMVAWTKEKYLNQLMINSQALENFENLTMHIFILISAKLCFIMLVQMSSPNNSLSRYG